MARRRRETSTWKVLRKWLQKRWKVLLAFLLLVSATIAVSAWLFNFTTLQNIVLLLVAAVVGTLGVLSDIKSVFGEETRPGGETKVEGEQVQVISGEGARGVQVKNGDYYEGGTHVYPPAPEKPSPQQTAIPGMRSPVYIPRGAVEDELRAALRLAGANALVGAGGMGGVGKTELAKQLARELREQGKPVLWLETAGRSLEQVHLEMARALGVTLPPTGDKDDRKRVLDSVLETYSYTVFIDDVRQEFLNNLPYCLPPSPPCAALVTSRRLELPGLAPGAIRYLDVMDLQQARDLLRCHIGINKLLADEPGIEDEIIKACGYHPLALSLAAGRLVNHARQSCTPAADLLHALRNRLDELKRAGKDKDANLRANFELSYAELTEKEKEVYRALAVFAPSGFRVNGVVAVCRLLEPDAQRMLENLLNRSLIFQDKSTELERFRLHDLLRDYAEEKLWQEEKRLRNAFLAEWLINIFKKNELADRSKVRDVATEQDNLVQAINAAIKMNDRICLARLATRSRNWLELWMMWSEWETWLKISQRELLNSDVNLKAQVFDCLGDIYQKFHKQYVDAIEYYKKACAYYKLAGDKRGYAYALKSQADALHLCNKNVEAQKNYKAALVIFNKESEIGKANTLLGMADISMDNHNYHEAYKYYSEALNLYRTVGFRLGEAKALSRIGNMEKVLEKYIIAIEKYQKAIHLYHEVGDRLNEASTLLELADVYKCRENYISAEKTYNKAINIYHEVGDSDRERISLQHLGDLLRSKGRYREAEKCYSEAVLIYQEINKPENCWGSARMFQSLGDVQRTLQKFDEAELNYCKAIVLFQNEMNLLNAAITLRSLGDIQQHQKKYREAIKSYNNALKFFRRRYDSQQVAGTLHSLGDVQRIQKHYSSAVKSYAHALNLYSNSLNLPSMANAFYSIGDVQRMQNRNDPALENLTRALELFRQVGDRPGEANALARRGQVLLAQGDQAEADRLLAQAVAIYTAIGDRYSIAASTGNYGVTLYDLGKKAAARSYLLRAAEIFEEIGFTEKAQRFSETAAEED